MARQLAERDKGFLSDPKPDWCKQRTEPLEVLCLGMCRTGTTSMLEALAILGYGTSYNSREMFRRGHVRFAREGLISKYEIGRRAFSRENFESLWGDYRTISGEPAYIFATELLDLYPDAKVILTVRDDEQKWLQSLINTMWYLRINRLNNFLSYMDPAHKVMRMFLDSYWKYLFHDDVPMHGIRVYREHNAMIKRLAAGRLHVFNTAEGWKPLCEFLGKDVPDVPFPHCNNTEEHRWKFALGRRKALIRVVKTLIIWGGLPAILVGVFLWRRWQLRRTVVR